MDAQPAEESQWPEPLIRDEAEQEPDLDDDDAEVNPDDELADGDGDGDQDPDAEGDDAEADADADPDADDADAANSTAAAQPASHPDSDLNTDAASLSHFSPADAEVDPDADGDAQADADADAAPTDRSHFQKDDEESKQPVDHIEQVLARAPSGVSTGMQADDGFDPNESEVVETANAGGQTGEDGADPMELLEQSEGGFPPGGGQQSLPVEVTIMPDGFKHLELFRGEESIGDVKAVLSDKFRIDPRQMRLALGDLVLEDDRTLAEYREFDVERMRQQGMGEEEVHSHALCFVLSIEHDAGAATADGEDAQPREEYKMPDILKVVINREELELEEEEEEEEKHLAGEAGRPERTPEQVVYVQVIRDNLHHPKPFLGGFRHKFYGTIYHHAGSQTARKKKTQATVKFHRETQTIQIISRSQQTNREAGTQMERRDLLQDHSNDRVIMSRPYFTADELEALRDEKAREVQCFLRQCFAWRRVRRLREAKAEKLDAEIKARAVKAKQEAEDHARQIQRRMHPRTKEDFAVLFAELEAWRLHETQRIKSSGLGAEEVASALQELLNKEVKLLQTIDRLKITAAKENKWTRTQTALEKMASPKEWSSSEGDLIEVETPFTTRAKELVDLYNGLCLRNLSRAQRVDVLLHIKYTVKEFDCELSREIVELIKREEDLLRRQRSEASLEACRKRLQNLFLQFVHTPNFNPEAANFQRVPADGGVAVPPPALSSSLAKPASLNRSNTITVASNVAGRIFAAKK